MRIATFREAGRFLEGARDILERDEVKNHLILGITQRMAAQLTRVGASPFLAIVGEREENMLAAMMTPPFPLVLAPLEAYHPTAIDVLSAHLTSNGWEVREVNGPEAVSLAFATRWSEAWGLHYEVGLQQGLYSASQVQVPGAVPGHLSLATRAEYPLVIEWGQAFYKEVLPDLEPSIGEAMIQNNLEAGNVYLWWAETPVSMAVKNRPSKNGIAVSYVYTPPSHRRQGYASACTAALSAALLEGSYQFCTLFTDLNNPTTNRIYQNIGYRFQCRFTSYRFMESPTQGRG